MTGPELFHTLYPHLNYWNLKNHGNFSMQYFSDKAAEITKRIKEENDDQRN